MDFCYEIEAPQKNTQMSPVLEHSLKTITVVVVAEIR